MPTPKSDKDDPIDDGMFDFLDGDAANRPARRKANEESPQHRSADTPGDGRASRGDHTGAALDTDSTFEEQHPRVRAPKPLPIIRKPVPVSESGPNSSPRAADATGRKTPQKAAATSDFDDDFGFLKEGRTNVEQKPASAAARSSMHNSDGAVYARSRSRSNPAAAKTDELFERDFDEDWNEGLHDYEYENDSRGRPRRSLVWLALGGIAVLGVGSFALERSGLFDSVLNPESPAATTVAAPAEVNAPVRSSVAEQFRIDLQRIEALVASGEFDAATQALDTLDPRVLGYGNPEFTALRDQIERGDTGDAQTQAGEGREEIETRLAEQAVAAEQARLAAQAQRVEEAQLAAEVQRVEEARVAAEAQRAEEARLAAEAQRAEEARLAAEAQRAEEARLAAEAQRAEEARLAAEAQQAEEARLAAEAQRAEEARQAVEAQRAEEARLAADAQRAEEARLAAEAQRAEEARLAAEAQRAEEARLAAEAQRVEEARQAAEARRAEQARQAAVARRAEEARALRAEQARAAAANASVPNAQDEADRLERERREVIAAEQRARARQAAAQRAAQISGQGVSAPAPIFSTPSATDREASDRLAAAAAQNTRQLRRDVPARPAPITDAEFNVAYRRFIDVKNAMERQDINTITQLAETNGTRVQNLLQLFSNSDSLAVRIDNVSTRNSTGTIVGTLTIDNVVRRGGASSNPPANLRSFTLTTRRDASGWSKIQW